VRSRAVIWMARWRSTRSSSPSRTAIRTTSSCSPTFNSSVVIRSAVQRYLAAVDCVREDRLFKNAIAVCKKMMRLGLSPSQVLERLAHLHVLDGLPTEAALYQQQYAEHLVRDQRPTEAAAALRRAYEASPDELQLLERIAEVLLLGDDKVGAALALAEACLPASETRSRGRGRGAQAPGGRSQVGLGARLRSECACSAPMRRPKRPAPAGGGRRDRRDAGTASAALASIRRRDRKRYRAFPRDDERQCPANTAPSAAASAVANGQSAGTRLLSAGRDRGHAAAGSGEAPPRRVGRGLAPADGCRAGV
jgi:hypothetical protein